MAILLGGTVGDKIKVTLVCAKTETQRVLLICATLTKRERFCGVNLAVLRLYAFRR